MRRSTAVRLISDNGPLSEQALAHVIGDKVEAADRRGDLLDRRRELMKAWAEYCGRAPGAGGKVVQMRFAGLGA